MSQMVALPRVVSFDCQGFRLYGTLHMPEIGPPGEVGMIVLNQGPLERAGAHRISMRIAQRWARQGFPVLRIDARGVGESEGDWTTPEDGAPIRLLYKQVEEGAWIADAHAAIDFMVAETGVQHVILAGLCGGAITALHAATHPNVRGVVMVGMPVRPWSEVEGAGDLVDDKIQEEARGYLVKAFSLEPWKRFLTMRTDYDTLWSVVSTRLHRMITRRSVEIDLNAQLLRSFEAATQAKRRLFFVYPANDYLWTEFRGLFLERFPPEKHDYALATVPDANHTFTEAAWQAELYRLLEEWAATQLTSGAAA
jgi:pimeloyl-ACP methyl ester carboxylesterase